MRELVTPTGAAIVSTVASHFGAQPAMKVRAIGYGAGAADLKEQANVLRLMLGEGKSIQPAAGAWNETAVVLETNLDDMNPQVLGYFVDRAFEAGALDVFFTPVQMKKNRPGQLVTVLCSPEKCDSLTDLIFRETTTLGVRRSNVQRRTLCRESIAVETKLGRVSVKIARLNGQILNAVPEYDDCQKIAAERAIPLKQVMAEVMCEFQRMQTDKNR